ncbi:glycoside hydrolase family 5 protein [Kitasatospora sp. NPDC048286]|uniref:glycoside hydrolase family 5 protein n=1 Tax=Kitasatospora sp. NPDC048286 TaxID=3364047 RepID=UPI0037179BD7
MRSARTAYGRARPTTRSLPALLAAAALLVGAAPGAAATPTSAATTADPVAMTGAQLAASWTGPLSTRGRYIVDAGGNRFKLKAGNWAGAQGTYEGSGDVNDVVNHQAKQMSNNIPLGLDRTPLSQITADFHALGINSIRLPFANAMIHDSTVVPDSAVTANPQLKGKTPLQVYDAVVAALTADGFAVIPNNHTTTYRFCCGLDGNERWNSGQSTEQWVDDWVFLANRYKANKRVVGADLRNEVRRDTWDDPNWGWGDSHDEYAAFEEAGNKILQADPDMLIIMEGINWQGIPSGLFSHGRPMLTPVRTLSNTLIGSGKLVYSAHFYGFTGPNHTGSDGGWQNGETNDPRYRDLTPQQLVQAVNDEALFVTQEGQHFTAPVWISEFGDGGRGNGDNPDKREADAKERVWFKNFTDILVQNDTDFAQWPLIGWMDATGKPNDNWALINYDATGRKLSVNDPGDWRAGDWNKLVNAPARTGPVPQADHWNMINLDHGDQNLSARMLAQGDWRPGNHKGNCPDSQRLLGVSRSKSRGLCTDASQPAKSSGPWVTVTDERFVTHGDWASGYLKLQCPDNHFAVGYSVDGNSLSGLLCAPAATTLPTAGRGTVWFDWGDNPSNAGSIHGDWASGDYKGQCADNEYVAGIAHGGWQDHYVPDALLCRPLS